MKLAGLELRQRDGVTCGPSVALMTGALLDPARRAVLSDPASGPALFAAQQARLHIELNRVWPRRFGTTPQAMARALTSQASTAGVPYRWRLFRGRHDGLADVLDAIGSDRPVAMLVGRLIPRHWVLIVDVGEPPGLGHALAGQAAAGRTFECYEPSSGEVRAVDLAAVREARLTGLGYPQPFAFVLPYSNV